MIIHGNEIELYRYFIYISYLGTNYRGWQVQPGKPTVQRVVENALSVILQESIAVTGAGRTDTGVHAANFVAHFDSRKDDLATRQNILFRLNRFLPADIAAERIIAVKPDSHARFDALSRTYEYTISIRKDPFLTGRAWMRHGTLDIEKMNQACTCMMEYRDFTSFSKLHTDVKTNNCVISEAGWRREKSLLIFRITADRFLRNMVRAITGTMVDIGSGLMEPEGIRVIIEAKDRSKAGKSAVADGLVLKSIEYPESLFTAH
ncbi:MAG: tRNA pseudouridine(38-40) synthase TruA [Bacteroidales bacterium]|nr:tRNA pseudouridine(38-40) synthase TruA [Bacteroidales bacterium]